MFFKTVIVAIAMVVTAQYVSAQDAQEESTALSKLCVIQSAAIAESSGIAHSHHYEDAVWTHNDSGRSSTAYLVSTQSGETLIEVSIESAENRDWEDIDSFQFADKNYLLIADIGDNLRKRSTYQLCIFPEPELELTDVEQPHRIRLRDWKDIRFNYEDGSHDCEAVAADMNSNQIILLEKIYLNDKRAPGIYVIELPTKKTTAPLTATRAGELSLKNITAMDLSADGNTMVIRTYLEGYVYTKTSQQTWPEVLADAKPRRIGLPIQRQGEGICFTRDESGVICSSEFRNSALWRVNLENGNDTKAKDLNTLGESSNEPKPAAVKTD